MYTGELLQVTPENILLLESQKYTSQQKKRYKGLMLNIFYMEKTIDKNRII